jgi:hypothetical protein
VSNSTVAVPLPEMGTEPEEWEFCDSAGTPRPFTGWLLAEESTGSEGSVRWTEIKVFWTTDGKYVLYICGCSDVYHGISSSCNTGDPMTAEAMREEGVLHPCRICKPGDYMSAPGERVYAVEVDLPNVKTANTPEKLIAALRENRDGNSEGRLSFIAQRILRQLRITDPRIAQVLERPRPL